MRSRWWCFFFSSRRRHTRYWRDWSSDVCSSDLPYRHRRRQSRRARRLERRRQPVPAAARSAQKPGADPKSVVEGKRVDLGGRRIIKKKKEGLTKEGREAEDERQKGRSATQ